LLFTKILGYVGDDSGMVYFANCIFMMLHSCFPVVQTSFFSRKA